MKSAITLDEIVQQRTLGWLDFGPEDYCHRCGGRNAGSWWVASPLWNAARIEDKIPSGIVCPSCFVELFEAAGGGSPSWQLLPDEQTTKRLRWHLREALNTWRRAWHDRFGYYPGCTEDEESLHVPLGRAEVDS